jgi:hypothetical protein
MQGTHISIAMCQLSTFQNDIYARYSYFYSHVLENTFQKDIYARYSYFYSHVPASTFQNHDCVLRLSPKEATTVTKHYQGNIGRNTAE